MSQFFITYKYFGTDPKAIADSIRVEQTIEFPPELTPEWIQHEMKIPVGEYAAYAAQFNPVKYDADAWVRLAKEAGMKYIVITSKHHDGFALFRIQ